MNIGTIRSVTRGMEGWRSRNQLPLFCVDSVIKGGVALSLIYDMYCLSDYRPRHTHNKGLTHTAEIDPKHTKAHA